MLSLKLFYIYAVQFCFAYFESVVAVFHNIHDYCYYDYTSFLISSVYGGTSGF